MKLFRLALDAVDTCRRDRRNGHTLSGGQRFRSDRRAVRVLPGGHIDLYYLGLRRKDARFDQGTALEERHSLGARVWGAYSEFDYNFEFVGQSGDFGGASPVTIRHRLRRPV